MPVVLDRSLRLDVETLIMAMIHDGRLRPDDRVPETEIARTLGISRTPVREALIRLSAGGLLRHEPRRGAYLVRLQRDEAHEVCAARAHLEGYCAGLAATRLIGDDLEGLSSIVRDMEHAATQGDWTGSLHLNIRFHEAVVRGAGNRMLHRLWTSVNPFVWLLTPLTTPGRDPQMDDLAERHQALVDALASRSPERAEVAFKEHIARSLRAAIAERSNSTGEAGTETGR